MFGSVKEGDAGSFWRWFVKTAPRIAADFESMQAGRITSESMLKGVGKKLREYHPDLAFEIGKDGSVYDFVISAEGMQVNIAPVLNLVRAAPTIPNWKVTTFRKRMPLLDAVLQFGPSELDWNKVCFKLAPPHDGRCDLTIGFETGSLPADLDLRSPGFLTADIALGEYDVMTKIGNVDFTWIASAAEPSFSPITELAEQFDGYFPPVGN